MKLKSTHVFFASALLAYTDIGFLAANAGKPVAIIWAALAASAGYLMVTAAVEVRK